MLIIRNSKIIIGLIILGVIISFLFIPRLYVKHDLKSFFVEGDSDLDFYNDFRKSFKSDENILMIAIHSEKGIYDYKLLHEIHDFTLKCKRISHVINANSITTYKDYINSPMGIMSFPFLHYKDSTKYISDSIRISKNSNINDWFVSKDSKTLTVILETDPTIDEKSKDHLISNLDTLLENYSFEEVHFAGSLNYETRYFRMIGKELQFNIILSSIVIVLVLIIIFRSIAGVLIPVITVIISMVFLYGLLGLFSRPLNVLSTLFPTIMLIVGISNLIHILSKYKDLLSKGLERKKAIKETFKELRITIFVTSFTTAIGFFSLAISSMKAFRNFGIEAGIGVLIAFVVSVTFVPALLHNIKAKSIGKNHKLENSVLSQILDKIFKIVIKFPTRIIAVTAVIFIVSIFGLLHINTNNFILSNFSNTASLKKDFIFFEENLSGVRTFEMSVSTFDGDSLTDINILRKIDKLQSYLEDSLDFKQVYSPVSIYKSMNRIYNGGVSNTYVLPENQSKINKYDKVALKLNRKLYSQFIDSTHTKGRITARIKDIGTTKIKHLNQQTNDWINNNITDNNLKFRTTGSMFLTDKSNDYLIRNMLMSLALAFIIVSILMFLLFKDLKMVIISLIPNILPLFVVAAIIGFTDIIFNGSVAIIFSIGFVIAVDDTIHFLSKFKLELSNGHDVKKAIKITLEETGKAIITTSIILFFGFIILVHSEMKGVFYQGLLVAIMLLAALIADLFLLPVLLIRFIKNN